MEINSSNNMSWPVYEELPTKVEVSNLLDNFLQENPHFDGQIKVGKTFIETIFPPPTTNDEFIAPRYAATDEYESLSGDNILC